MINLIKNNNAGTNLLERKLTLIKLRSYKITDCYSSALSIDNEAFIKGLYIVRDDAFGEMPQSLTITLKRDKNIEINYKTLQYLYSEDFRKYGDNCVIVNDNLFRIILIFYLKDYYETHLKYTAASKIRGRKLINNMYFHKMYVPEIPQHLYSIIEWTYREKHVDKSQKKTGFLYPWELPQIGLRKYFE